MGSSSERFPGLPRFSLHNRRARLRMGRPAGGGRAHDGDSRALVKGDFPCAGPEAPAISFAAPTGWDRTCTSVNAVGGVAESSPASVLRAELSATHAPRTRFTAADSPRPPSPEWTPDAPSAWHRPTRRTWVRCLRRSPVPCESFQRLPPSFLSMESLYVLHLASCTHRRLSLRRRLIHR
jgi:hypothetical protein